MRAGPLALRRRERALAPERRRRSLDRTPAPGSSGRSAAAIGARDETGGLFDPAVLPALVAAGYDRSFEQLEPRAARPAFGWRAGAAVEVDHTRAPRSDRAGRGGRPRRHRKGLLGRPRRAGDDRRLAVDAGLRSSTSAAISPSGASRRIGGPWRIAVADPRHGGAGSASSACAPAGSRPRDATGAASASTASCTT